MTAMGRLATTALASHSCPSTSGGLAMNITATCSRQPWNKGKLVGQKTPLRLRDIWAIRVRLQIAERTRDLALLGNCTPPDHPFALHLPTHLHSTLPVVCIEFDQHIDSIPQSVISD